jgi:SlyX protein
LSISKTAKTGVFVGKSRQWRASSTNQQETSMGSADERLTALEIRAAEQEHTIEELSGQLADQWKTMDRMQRKLDTLTQRFLALEEQTAPDVPVTKPPHW